jgi:hypothetical protein
MLQFVHNAIGHSVIKMMSNITVKFLLPNLHLRFTIFRPEKSRSVPQYCQKVLQYIVAMAEINKR